MREHHSHQHVSTTSPRRRRSGLFRSAVALLVAGAIVVSNAAPASASVEGDRVDFNGSGLAFLTVFRPSTGEWYGRTIFGNNFNLAWGTSGDFPVSEDYDGDGIAEIAIYRPTTGQWWLRSSIDGSVSVYGFGGGSDLPVPGRWVGGDDRADLAIYRPSTRQWWIRDSANGAISVLNFGAAGDVPIPGDYDGDDVMDAAVRKANGQNWWRDSGSGAVAVVNFGLGTDTDATGDYDGDGQTDWAKVRVQNGNLVWYILQSTNGYAQQTFGLTNDKIVPGDYDGDGKVDIAVFRPSTGTWWIRRTGAPTILQISLGTTNDLPAISTYVR